MTSAGEPAYEFGGMACVSRFGGASFDTRLSEITRGSMTVKQLTTQTTYLEMLALDLRPRAAPAGDLDVVRLPAPELKEYRALYSSVGQAHRWVDRLLMPDDELQRILQDDRVEIYLLKVDRQLAGYAELDRRVPGQIEIAYFGLLPQFIGRGLGKYLLGWTLERAWSYQPNRVWVHTCDLDHAAALPNYLKAGFRIYDQRIVQQVVADE